MHLIELLPAAPIAANEAQMRSLSETLLLFLKLTLIVLIGIELIFFALCVLHYITESIAGLRSGTPTHDHTAAQPRNPPAGQNRPSPSTTPATPAAHTPGTSPTPTTTSGTTNTTSTTPTTARDTAHHDPHRVDPVPSPALRSVLRAADDTPTTPHTEHTGEPHHE